MNPKRKRVRISILKQNKKGKRMLLQKEKGKGKKIVPQSFKLRKERNIKG